MYTALTENHSPLHFQLQYIGIPMCRKVQKCIYGMPLLPAAHHTPDKQRTSPQCKDAEGTLTHGSQVRFYTECQHDANLEQAPRGSSEKFFQKDA